MAPPGCGNESCSASGALASRPLASNEDLWLRAVAAGTGVTVTGLKASPGKGAPEIKAAVVTCLASYPVLGAHILLPHGKSKAELHLCRLPAGADLGPASGPQEASSQLPRGLLEFLEFPELEPGAEGGSDLHLLVEAGLNAPFAAEGISVPVFQVGVYQRPTERSSYIILRMHHACFDRVSALNVTRAFSAALGSGPAPAKDTSAPLLPPPLGDLIPKDIRSKGLLSKLVDGVGYIAKAQGCALLPFDASGADADCRKTPFRTQVLALKLSAQEASALLRACREKGCSLFGAEAAAVLKATAEAKHLGSKAENFQMTCLVGCRPYLDPPPAPSSLGLLDAGFPLKLSVSQSSDFWALAREVSESAARQVEQRRHFTEMPVLDALFSQVLGNPGLTPGGSLRTALLTGFVDAPMRLYGEDPATSATMSAATSAVEEVLGPIASCHGVGPCISLPHILLPSGELQLFMAYASPLYNRSSMAMLGAKIVGYLSIEAPLL